jgi:1,4-dihydroxy-6-naphthoate synthase
VADPTLSLGFSPCPNDTFIFHALVGGLVPAPAALRPRLEDVETLNRRALAGELDVSKVSYGALPYLLDDYVLLRSGGALGRGCGPLLVARAGHEFPRRDDLRLAVPGRYTTANLLLRLWRPELPAGIEYVYSEIMPAVARGEVDAGLIIHESRFTYADHGLQAVVDLGEWWERDTGLPIPLGGIVAKRSLGEDLLRALEAAIRGSVEYAFANPAASGDYVRAHAQELDDEVTRRHIELYVNAYSVTLGDDGEAAVRGLVERAVAAGATLRAGEAFL